MRKHLLILFILLVTVCQVFAQGSEITITGKVLDSQTKEPLIGASVLAKGTSKATSVSLNGTFKLKLDDANATLVITYIGYIAKEIPLNGKKELGVIEMVSNASTMSEVTVTSDLAIDRKTPIAASTISAEYIEEKGGSQELPELLKETPGVMATETGGGFGDSRITIRGFSNNNVALMINGIPGNDVEAGKIFWSDWAGLLDVASSIQVQRGLGASKLAVPSLGGTIGITTRSTDAVQGGSFTESIGSYGDQKTAISLSTGLNSKGWAASFLLAKRSGDGKAFGLYYTGYSYFLNISKVLTKHQSLSFNILGAAQSHGQRFTEAYVSAYRNSPDGIRFNPDWGYLNGTLTSAEINYYNKPLASLTHNWIINESSSLSSTLYASFGAGAARYLQPYNYNTADVPRVAGAYSPIDFTAIQQYNESTVDGAGKYYIQNVVNNHQQYGATSKYNKKLGDFDFLAGMDMRYYSAAHYNQVQNLLGAQYMLDPFQQDVKNPNYHLKVGDRFDQNYVYNIASEGLFLQSEYSKNDLTAFVALAATNTGNQRIDYFSYAANDPAYKTKYVNFWGYQTKGGLNYNIDSHNNVFANIGYLQRAPLVSTIFLDFKNDVNPNAVPEKLLSYELGYGFRSSQLTANVNLYRSTYKDRSVAPKDVVASDGSLSTANISGLNELHQGVEFDSRYRPFKGLTLRTMLSIGDWHYLTNTGPITINGNSPTTGKPVTTTVPGIQIAGTKIGDAAQTTASVGADVNVLPTVKLGATYNYFGNYSTSYNPILVTFPGYTPYKLPNYNLLDLNIVFRLKIEGFEASFIGNVNNVLDTKYFSDAYDNSVTSPTPTASTVGVYYGIGRTYTTTLKVKF
jgi:iron complex outermembrane receptor protein